MDEDERFVEFVSARRTRLFRLAYLLTAEASAAEDLLQTALAKLALRWTGLESADAYVRKILYNQQVSIWRRLGPRREQAWADPPDLVATGDESGDAVERIALARVLARLTPRQRAVIILRYYEDLPEAEVAQLLGCSVGTVRSQTHRTLARLRELAPDRVSLKES